MTDTTADETTNGNTDALRILVASDHHAEIGGDFPDPRDLDAAPVDVAVLAGDVANGEEGPQLAARLARRLGVPTVFVPGNHEFYGHDIDRMRDLIVRHHGDANGLLHVLDDTVSVIAFGERRITFAGGTLWTDYALNGTAMRRKAMAEAGLTMNDHRLISVQGHAFRPDDAMDLNAATRAHLERVLTNLPAPETVVVTHHAPSGACEAERYRGGRMSPAFCNALDGMIRRLQPRLWVHGHTHQDCDVTIGSTRVVSAQRGYPGEKAYHPLIVTI